MKKNFTLLAILIFSVSFANQIFQFENVDNKILGHFENENIQAHQTKNKITKIIAIPAKNVKIEIHNCEISIFKKDGEFIQNTFVNGEKFVRAENSFVMRELFGHKISIKLFSENDKNISVLKNIDFEIKPQNLEHYSEKISHAFLPIYQTIIENFESSYLAEAEVVPSKMLIIAPSSTTECLESYINWKQAKGISTTVVTSEEIGTTSGEIKTYLQNLYDSSEQPPDYLLLIGDVDGSYEIPSFYFGDDDDVSDHPYTLLDGDDYFPEMLVGRISIDSLMELVTILNKILAYEKTPYVENPDWLTRAILVAGNYSTSPPIPSTPVKVSRWLWEKMLNYGYSQVDTVFYPPTYPGTSEISSSINNGVGFVNYRGWGDANGWHYPYFHSENIEALSNGYFLPVVTSFVCNTGDFANNVDPCFGETWLRAGTPSLPKGAVVFVGPSDLHTSTKYNNSLFSGFYYGMLDENILSFGQALLRGKLELYNNFPLNQEDEDDVEFYFHVYNILGDPSLSMWTQIPEEINCNLPGEISLGTNYLEISIPNFDDGIVTAIKENEFSETAIIGAGNAVLYFNSQTEGEITITITKPNYYPLIETVQVVTAEGDIGLLNIESDSEIIAGNQINLLLTLKNFGAQTENNISATLTSNSAFITFSDDNAEFGNLAPNATAEETFQIEIFPNCPNGEILEFTLEISNENDAKFELFTHSLLYEVVEVEVQDENGILEPGEEREIQVTINNIGTIEPLNLSAELSTNIDAVVIIDNFSTVEDTATFTVAAANDCSIGKLINFTIQLSDEIGLETSANFYLEIGEVTNCAPTGPDAFGYYAYDKYDVNYDECPVYEWIEIDPEDGGNGTVFELGDDRSETIEIPIDFKFYDEICDSLKICTNGWISFNPTWETYFRNWNIPSALGP
ncbi:MAG: hypothetical protein ISS38_03170, partial [Candidatus Cloacimonetes bacterium]|nr:hypothetical protein [Candidatus Cloacimonadota bacterium]